MEGQAPSSTGPAIAGALRIWRLEAAALPPILRTLRLAEAARAAVMRRAEALRGNPRLPDCLHGPGGSGAPHRHAYWLPVDLGGEGRIDHLAVHVPGGLCDEAEALLDGLHAIRLHGHGTLGLVPATAPEVRAAVAGPARLWVSALPFFGALHARPTGGGPPRPGRDAAAQLARELGRLGRDLPEAEIAALPCAPAGPEAFLTGARGKARPVRPVHGLFALAFATPVAGPLALGFAAHFGLGRFRPAEPKLQGGVAKPGRC